MARKRNKYYVGKDELMEELRKFNESMANDPDGIGTATEELGEMLLKIATRYASRPNFWRYSFREDFVNEAIFRMVKNLHKIDLDHPKCNPFSYLTMICHNVFIFWIMKSKKHEQAKLEIAREHLIDLEYMNDIDRSQQLQILDEIQSAQFGNKSKDSDK